MVLPSTGEILSWDKKVDFAEVVVRYCSLAPLWLTKDDKIAYSDQKFCDWDLKLLQATQHQGSQDWQISGLPVVAALSR